MGAGQTNCCATNHNLQLQDQNTLVTEKVQSDDGKGSTETAKVDQFVVKRINSQIQTPQDDLKKYFTNSSVSKLSIKAKENYDDLDSQSISRIRSDRIGISVSNTFRQDQQNRSPLRSNTPNCRGRNQSKTGTINNQHEFFFFHFLRKFVDLTSQPKYISNKNFQEEYNSKIKSFNTQQSSNSQFNDVPYQMSIFIKLQKGDFSKQYQTIELLGEGAYGKVMKVKHIPTSNMRAMKAIVQSSIIEEEKERLFSEMNILKTLDHPNIIKLYELYQDEQHYYLITEQRTKFKINLANPLFIVTLLGFSRLCTGGQLFEKIKAQSSFSQREAANYMKQILQVIHYCHSQNIVHRDIQPENILFCDKSENSSLKIIDFGTSRMFDSQKKMTKKLGTPYYIAPEVLQMDYDQKCDVWSCGVILYIMLCGYPPFGGRGEIAIIEQVKKGAFQFDPADWDKISGDAKNLIQQMLTFEPKKRITAQEALYDPWVQNNAPKTVLSDRALNNLSEFHIHNKLKHAIITFIACQLVSQQELDELKKTFAALDTNGDGKLSPQQLIKGYALVLGDEELAQQNVRQLLPNIDINKSQQIEYSEFVTAAMNRNQILSQTKMQQAFSMFDKDGNGLLTRDQFENIMGEISDKQWQNILKEYDENNDGMISLQQFMDMLLKKRIE